MAILNGRPGFRPEIAPSCFGVLITKLANMRQPTITRFRIDERMHYAINDVGSHNILN